MEQEYTITLKFKQSVLEELKQHLAMRAALVQTEMDSPTFEDRILCSILESKKEKITMAFTISNHHLFPADFIESPNQGSLFLNPPDAIILHFTAGTYAGTVNHFSQTKNKVSAHLIIGRNGQVMQMVEFNRIAWHAGKSIWQGRSNLNQYSIGIEFENWGTLTRRAGRWITWTRLPIPEQEVETKRGIGWHRYAPEQLQIGKEIMQVLIDNYPIQFVLGHSDIAPGRKADPGPLMDMEKIRKEILG